MDTKTRWIFICCWILGLMVHDGGGVSFMSTFAKKGSSKFRDLSAKCQAENGRCATFRACDTTSHIYKGYCKTDYSEVCCVPRATVCDAHDGICTDDPEACEAAGAIMGLKYQIQFKTWLTCNSTHTCCRPIPKDKDVGMSYFKSQFPEIEVSTNQVRRRPARVPAPAPTPAPAPALPPAPMVDYDILDTSGEEMTEEEKQAAIGEAVLAVLAANPSMSLQEAMQHPSVRQVAGEPPLNASPARQQPLAYTSAEVGGGLGGGFGGGLGGGGLGGGLRGGLGGGGGALARRRQMAALLKRKRRLQQMRQAMAARELAVQRHQRVKQRQEQESSSIFPGHYMTDAVDTEIQKRLYNSGMDYPYDGQQAALSVYNQPHPLSSTGSFPSDAGAFQNGYYEKQGVSPPASSYKFTHRTLGTVNLPGTGTHQQPQPQQSNVEDDQFGFKDNADFAQGNSQNGYGPPNPYSNYLG